MSAKHRKEKSGNKPNGHDSPKASIKQKMSEILDLPKEIVMNIPKLTMVGNTDLIVENYRGIIEYEDNTIRVNTGSGVIKITGEKLVIREITSEDILISGEIASLEFQK